MKLARVVQNQLAAGWGLGEQGEAAAAGRKGRKACTKAGMGRKRKRRGVKPQRLTGPSPAKRLEMVQESEMPTLFEGRDGAYYLSVPSPSREPAQRETSIYVYEPKSGNHKSSDHQRRGSSGREAGWEWGEGKTVCHWEASDEEG